MSKFNRLFLLGFCLIGIPLFLALGFLINSLKSNDYDYIIISRPVKPTVIYDTVTTRKVIYDTIIIKMQEKPHVQKIDTQLVKDSL